eukprot:sb/3470962/
MDSHTPPTRHHPPGSTAVLEPLDQFEDVALSSEHLEYDDQPAMPPSYEEAISRKDPKARPPKPAPPYCGIDAGPARPRSQPPPPTDPVVVYQVAQPPPTSLMAGQCAKFEEWLASKNGFRINLVVLIMSTILAIIAISLGLTLFILLFIMTGFVSLLLLIWCLVLRGQRRVRAGRLEVAVRQSDVMGTRGGNV